MFNIFLLLPIIAYSWKQIALNDFHPSNQSTICTHLSPYLPKIDQPKATLTNPWQTNDILSYPIIA